MNSTVKESAQGFIEALSESYFSDDGRIINERRVIEDFLEYRIVELPDFEFLKDAYGKNIPSSKLLEDKDAAMSIEMKTVFLRMQNTPRQRFTLCHEIGHIVLEHKKQLQKNERDANEFASELMFPYEQFNRDIKNLPVNIENINNLGNLYNASKSAVARQYAKKHFRPIAIAELNYNCEVNWCFESKSFPLRIDKGVKIKLKNKGSDSVLKSRLKNGNRNFDIEAVSYSGSLDGSYLVLLKYKGENQ